MMPDDSIGPTLERRSAPDPDQPGFDASRAIRRRCIIPTANPSDHPDQEPDRGRSRACRSRKWPSRAGRANSSPRVRDPRRPVDAHRERRAGSGPGTRTPDRSRTAPIGIATRDARQVPMRPGATHDLDASASHSIPGPGWQVNNPARRIREIFHKVGRTALSRSDGRGWAESIGPRVGAVRVVTVRRSTVRSRTPVWEIWLTRAAEFVITYQAAFHVNDEPVEPVWGPGMTSPLRSGSDPSTGGLRP